MDFTEQDPKPEQKPDLRALLAATTDTRTALEALKAIALNNLDRLDALEKEDVSLWAKLTGKG